MRRLISPKTVVAFLAIYFMATSPLWICESKAQTEGPPSSIPDTTKRGAQSSSGVDFRWKEGLHLGYQYRDILNLELGGRLQVDGGYTEANQTLRNAYPALQGWDDVLRSADVSLIATFYQTIQTKIEVEFADVRQFQEVWVASKKRIPILGYLTAGNMKEPFSLETLTGTSDITFMARSLPTNAFSPSYNLGFKFNNTALKERITWAVGGYWNTQDLNNVYRGGDPEDQFSTANGYSLAARLTGLPWYEDGGRGLLHLGVSYNFRARNDNKDGAEEKFSTRPESYLTDDKFVDTGNIPATRTNLTDGELAWVWGPFSLQGEYFRAFLNAQGNPDFWGFYVYGSFVLTGEHRSYDTANAIFAGITPRRNFNPPQGAWGAWELAARYSYIDLNSHGIRGGEEGNITLGLNWYLHPNLRLTFNYISASVNERTNPTVDHGRVNIFQGRFQIAF